MSCCDGYCGKCRGMMKALLGVLILINVFVWPKWTGIDGWVAFFGLLLIFAGIAKSLMPTCNCTECKMESSASAPAEHAKKSKK